MAQSLFIGLTRNHTANGFYCHDKPDHGACSACYDVTTRKFENMDHNVQHNLNAMRFGERCSMITNAASTSAHINAADAVATIGASLATCEAQLGALAARGKSQLPSYAKLKQRYLALKQKQAELRELCGRACT